MGNIKLLTLKLWMSLGYLAQVVDFYSFPNKSVWFSSSVTNATIMTRHNLSWSEICNSTVTVFMKENVGKGLSTLCNVDRSRYKTEVAYERFAREAEN